MTATIQRRLESWRRYQHSLGWVGDIARVVVPELEAEIARTKSLPDNHS